MIRNYLKIAWRNLVKYKIYSTVNIIGLSVGIVFSFLIGAFVWGEWRINRGLRNADQQYFLRSVWKDPNIGADITTLGPLSTQLKEKYPNLVVNAYRWDGITSGVSKGDKHFREPIQLGDSTLLEMFGFELLHGDERTALNEPYSVVITKEKAIKYFGKTDVVGESLTIQSFSGHKRDFKITGVFDKGPENSVTHLNENTDNHFFIPTNTFSYFGRQDLNAWTNNIIPSYIELRKGASLKDLDRAITQLINDNTPAIISQNLKVVPTPLTDYYLQKNNGLVKRMLFALSFVGLFILLMALINFINISISNSAGRTREIGVRKVLGSQRKQIIIQFITESIILVFFATLLAILLYSIGRPVFSELVGKQLPELNDFPLFFAVIPIILIIVLGISAGLYPALVLSAMKTSDSIKGKLQSVKENILLRKSLVGFQFSIATIVIVAALVVSQQVSFFFSQELGYDKDYIVSSQVPRDWTRAGLLKMETVRNEFASMPQVASVSLSYEIPNGMNGGQPLVFSSGKDSTTAVPMQLLLTDENYLSTYTIPIKAGSFIQDFNDSLNVVINERAAGILGYKNPADAVGARVWANPTGQNILYTVKGVTKDFHFGTMQREIQPIIIFHPMMNNTYRFLSFKLKPGNIPNTLEAIQKKWAVLLPGSSFEYKFMDEALKKIYQSEIQLKKAAYAAGSLALVIVLLGIFGLVSLSIQKRTKEVGIRKVLGASMQSIVSLFLKDFLGVILVAGLIACPIAYLIMNNWLEDYASRISITAQPFLLAIGGLFLMATVLVTFQSMKTGSRNLVKSLRTE